MHAPAPGWYVIISPSRFRPATDSRGPFGSEAEMMDWLRLHHFEIIETVPSLIPAVPWHAEMTDDCLEAEGLDWSPWATGIREVK